MEAAFARYTAAPAEGKRAALEALLAEVRPVMYRAAKGITKDEAAADDVVQDALLRLVSPGLEAFQGRGSFTSYVIRIARNVAISSLRRDEPAELPQLADEAPSPEAELIAEEEQATLAAALLRLRHRRPRWAKAIALSLEGRSNAEIAEALGTCLINARQLVFRGRHALREIINNAHG